MDGHKSEPEAPATAPAEPTGDVDAPEERVDDETTADESKTTRRQE